MNKKKWLRILAVTVALFIVSVIVIQATITGGGTINTYQVSFVTDEGVNLNATLYKPVGATAETPAAGIVVCPGGNTPHTFYASYSIELARRGYVVLAYDYYGTVTSGMSTEGSSGSIAAMKYLSGLSFVDATRLGATGHSNGGGQATAAITSEYAASAQRRSVVFIGCGVGDATLLGDVNVMAIWGQLDEAGQGTFWDTYHKDRLNFSTMTEMTGTTNETIVPGQIYGDFAANNARVVYTPNTFHSMSNLVPESVENIISFMDNSLAGNTSTLTLGNRIYHWHEFAVLLAALCLCVMIFPVGMLLADMPFFGSMKRTVPEGVAKNNWKFWLFLLLPGIISALLVKDTIIQGQLLMGQLPRLFNVQSTDGFIWWFFLSALVGVAFLVVRMFVDKTFDRARFVSNLKTSPANLGKAAIFALCTVGVPYLFGVVSERLTGGWYARIFQTYMSSIGAHRLYEFPVYFILFAILFTVYAAIQADGLRLKNAKESTNYWITLLANALPALLFVGYIFGTLIFTHVTAINGREMSRANGAMMGMLLLYFVIAGVVTKFYKKTGNIYVVGMMNAAFVTWLSINTQQFIV